MSSSTVTPIDPATLPTLASTWTAPTSCFATTNYYRALLGGGYFSNLYGTPTPVLTGNAPSGVCFPPSFTINVPYRTDGNCPSGYTTACATGTTAKDGAAISSVTCCPSVTGNVFSFMCRDHQYGCHATATAGAVWTGVITDLSSSTQQPVTRTPSTAEGLEAWGIKFIQVSLDDTAAQEGGQSCDGMCGKPLTRYCRSRQSPAQAQPRPAAPAQARPALEPSQILLRPRAVAWDPAPLQVSWSVSSPW
ncbi:hypothetical protein GQ53DRAFT_666072 [Thozetella sp. PMI_491]|nr:hypothetical protein GQ53DRAFT_666072 [Thozetella sp. PMI_491]